MITLTRRQFAFLLGFAVIIWGSGHWILDISFTLKSILLLGISLGSVAFFSIALEYSLWRLPFLQGWLIRRPDLRGTWRVEIKPDLESYEATGQKVPPTSYMGVTQTLSSLKMHVMAHETESWFIADSIDYSRHKGGYRLVGVYKTRPHARQPNQQNEIHLGGMIMDTLGAPRHRPVSMRGQYWTDRKVKGATILTKISRQVYSHFSDAERAETTRR